jgi:hypothetical protein
VQTTNQKTPNDLDKNDEIDFNTNHKENVQLNKSVNNSQKETEAAENTLLVKEQDLSRWQVFQKIELVKEDLSSMSEHLKTTSTSTEESENILQIANNNVESIIQQTDKTTSETCWLNDDDDDDNENFIIHRLRITKQHYSETFEHHIFFGNIFVRWFCVMDFFILAILLHIFIEFMRY